MKLSPPSSSSLTSSTTTSSSSSSRRIPTVQKLIILALLSFLLLGLHTIRKERTHIHSAPTYTARTHSSINNGVLPQHTQIGRHPSSCQESENDGFVIAIRIVVEDAGGLKNDELTKVWEKMAAYTKQHEPGTIVYTLSQLTEEKFFTHDVAKDVDIDGGDDDDDANGPNSNPGGSEATDPVHTKKSPVPQTMLFYDRYCSSYDATVVHKQNSPWHARTKAAMQPLMIGSEPFGYTDTRLGFRVLEDGTVISNSDDDDDDDNNNNRKKRIVESCPNGGWLLFRQLKFAAALPESKAKETFRLALKTIGSFPPEILSFEVLESNKNARDCAIAVRTCSMKVAHAAAKLIRKAFAPHTLVLELDREGLYLDVGADHSSYYSKPLALQT